MNGRNNDSLKKKVEMILDLNLGLGQPRPGRNWVINKVMALCNGAVRNQTSI